MTYFLHNPGNFASADGGRADLDAHYDFRHRSNASGPPRLSFRDCLSLGCVGEGRFVRKMGPPGRFGVIDPVLESAEDPHAHRKLSWEVLDGVITAIKHGISEDEFDGDFLHGTVIRVVGGVDHERDSKLSCYVMATALSMRSAQTEAGLYVRTTAAQSGNVSE